MRGHSSIFVAGVFVFGTACSNTSGCNTQPLPGGALPADQTLEGGAQIRVTQQGLAKLTSVVPGLINEQIAGGFCIPRGEEFFTEYCMDNQGQCTPGCKVTVGLNQTTFSVTNAQTLTIRLDVNVDAVVPADAPGFSKCNIIVDGNNLKGDADIELGTDPTTGKLTVKLARIRNVDLSGLNFSGQGGSFCSGASSFADFLKDLFEQEIVDFLTPRLDDLIQDQLPNPLGLEGLVDITPLLANISPGTQGTMEARIIPGGFVTLDPNLQGISLGVITGANADEDITTRTPDLDSEPALCVPPIPAHNFGAPPHSLPVTPRASFRLDPGGLFAGAPDPAGKDLAIGISETGLDLIGHHAVTSGAMCLGIGTRVVEQLNVGTFGILVPSVAELASEDGKDPILLLTRPQKAVDFTIGDNTPQSPAITIHLREFEIDVYPFLYERYTRAFTMSANIDAGVNFEFEEVMPSQWRVKPTLVGLSSQSVQISVLNGEFLREDKATLEATLPTVFDLLASQLSIPAIDLPTFAGFRIDDPSMSHVVTPQDNFLALGATLDVGAAFRSLAPTNRFAAAVVEKFDHTRAPAQPRARGVAKLHGVRTPAPDRVRAALAGTGGELPAVTIDVDRVDDQGRELEWSWRIDSGFWRPYTSAQPLVIADRAFAWQGKYTIGLMARVKGQPATAAIVPEIPVVIDSVAPHVVTKTTGWDGDIYTMHAYDVVGADNVRIAFGTPGEAEPATPWIAGGTASIDRETADGLAVNGELVAYLEDEAGNREVVLIAPFHGQPGGGGCDCDAGGDLAGGTLVLIALVLLGFYRRVVVRIVARHGRSIAFVAVVAVTSAFLPACDCGGGPACELAEDCAAGCAQGTLPFCIDGICSCSDDILPGKIGPYSDVAVGPAGEIWVSAYAQNYGDLVAAQVVPGKVAPETWEFVDGVPDGPVVAEGSKIRGGIAEKGPDVGMYTSIGVGPDGTPSVSYFDVDTGSLALAQKVAGVWQIHTVDAGSGSLETDGVRAGLWSSITVRSDDGRPGIAYLAHVAEAGVVRAEVRFVAAQTATPTSAADWMSWVVDSADLPPADPENPEIYPLPNGLGLFVDATRQPNQAPAVVYYDRAAGDLKLSLFSPQSGQFQAPIVLDGSAGDEGWAPSVAIAADNVAHVSYGGLDQDDLHYVSTASAPETVDDGYRIVGTTSSGEPKPEHHFVGDDSAMVLTVNGPAIAYQDATTHELLFAAKDANGVWQRSTIAGAENPFVGAYGFFNAAALSATHIVVSTWVIDLPDDDNWVEVFALPLGTM